MRLPRWLPRASQPALLSLLLAGGAAAQTTAQTAPAIPEGYSAVPFLSEAPQQSFAEPGQVLEEGVDYGAVMVTNKGTLVLDLFEEDAPQTVNNFVFLARHHFYDGIVFHRVLDGFMAQTGDPTGTGTGGPGYQFDDEVTPDLTFDEAGILAMANAGPDTNGSQFFITFAETPWLNGAHTIFGEVTEGLEVLDTLERVDPSHSQEVPNLVVPPSDPLSVLQEQGVTLAGDPGTTVEAYLTEKLGAFPPMGERFEVDGFTGLVGQGEGGAPLVGFYTAQAEPDVIESVTVIKRNAE
jgi:cyclophilin family peptidyl-prolyl cis-trans isomerase